MLEAIKPARPLLDFATLDNLVNAAGNRWSARMVQEMGKYPPQQPTKSGYRRTGTLGRNWKTKAVRTSGSIEFHVENATDYAEYVEGQQGQQTSEMARRSWQRIDDVGDRVSKQTDAELTAALAAAAR